MVVFDANFLLALLEPERCAPRHPETHERVQRFSDRIENLIADIEIKKEKIVIPTPALSEILVRAVGSGSKYLELLEKSASFSLAGFDTRSAIEVAAFARAAIKTPSGKRDGQDTIWAKIKYDWQIIAIAKTNQAGAVYSDDKSIFNLGNKTGLPVIRTADLPLPPENRQGQLGLEQTPA